MADQRDTFGNQMQHTDQYGNPVPPRYTDLGGDTAGHDSTAAQHGQLHAKKPHGATGILHRSGSSSSSSSEEDGMGGRRKKGLKDKVKEKIPGGHKTDDQYGRTQVQQQHQQPRHEKPGMMEKVKEKIPGVHQTDEYGRPQAQQEPHTQVPQTHVQPEKKGMVEKIKEKIPGGH